MNAEKLYADRDIIRQGKHYVRHVYAMTAEGLHDKSAIAAELAHRDILIETLQAQNNKLAETVRDLSEVYRQHQSEIEQLKAIKFARFNNEECWLYQGDGNDHLESLVCPVVMPASKLLALLALSPPQPKSQTDSANQQAVARCSCPDPYKVKGLVACNKYNEERYYTDLCICGHSRACHQQPKGE